MIDIKCISYREVQNNDGLLSEYAHECSIPALGRPNPQWSMYDNLEQLGAYHCYGAYVDELLVGFAGVLIHPLPHYGILSGMIESLFVQQKYRGGTGIGLRLLNLARVDAKIMYGCKALIYSAVVGSTLDKMLDGMNIPLTNHVYCEAL